MFDSLINSHYKYPVLYIFLLISAIYSYFMFSELNKISIQYDSYFIFLISTFILFCLSIIFIPLYYKNSYKPLHDSWSRFKFDDFKILALLGLCDIIIGYITIHMLKTFDSTTYFINENIVNILFSSFVALNGFEIYKIFGVIFIIFGSLLFKY